MDATTASFGFSTKKHQDWFNNNDTSIQQLLSEKNAVMLPNSVTLHPLYYIRSGLSFVHARRKNFIKRKASGGPIKLTKSNPMQIPT